MSVRLQLAISNMSKKHEVVCECGNTWEIPVLWGSDVCERCGKEVLDTRPNLNETRKVMIKALEWAGIRWDRLGLTLNDPQELPEDLLKTIAKKTGQELSFLDIDDAFQWECQHCTLCCKQDVIFSKKTANMTEEEAQLINKDSTNRNLPRNEETGACVFWQSETNCSIHHIRPVFCRMFPLGMLNMTRLGKLEKYLGISGPGCPGLGKGKVWTVFEFLREAGILHKFYK